MSQLAPEPAAFAWRVAATVLRGRSHEKAGQPCQDALRWEVAPGQALLGSVADGAGSARFSEVGADLAAGSALETLKESLPREPEALAPEAVKMLLLRSLLTAQKSLWTEAARTRKEAREFATTLLVLVATSSWVAAGQVGDGATIIGDGQGRWTALTKPALSEYLNETVFLTSDSAEDQAQICFWQGTVHHIAMLSDGLQMLAMKMPDAQPHAPFFQPLFHWLEGAGDPKTAQLELESFLRSPRIMVRSDDDLTLLLATANSLHVP